MGARRIYKRATPYPASALGGLDYAQSNDILYAAHISYPPQKLSRYGHTDWRWTTLTFGPTVEPLTGATATPSVPNTTLIHYQTYEYVFTGVTNDTPAQETRASAVFTASNDMTLAGNYNTINLPALPAGIARFVIYRKQAGAFGYIGNTADATFRDENLQPILSETPVESYHPFLVAGNYPAAVTLHQQRLTYGATLNVINGVWMSRTADFENMDRSRPLRADDSLAFSLVSNKVNAVTHIESLKKSLMVLTGDGIWSVNGGDGGALTPSSIATERQTGRGATRVKPVVVDDILFHLTSKGSSLRALGFSFESDGYKSDNVSIFAPHLFTRAIIRMAFQEEPFACLWALRNDGVVLCLTWEQEQGVFGWAPMETDGFVEDICVIGETGFDRLYAVIRRTINGVPKRFLERMALPHTSTTTACHLDCSLTQVFETPTATINGLWHLEGETVSAIADGYAEHGLVVANGTVVLSNPATTVTIGLRYEGELETLPAALNTAQGSLQTLRQQITDVVVRTIDTKGISAGASGTELEQVEPEFGDDLNLDVDYHTHDYKVMIPGDWKDTSTIIVKQTEPFPAHIVGLFAGMNVND